MKKQILIATSNPGKAKEIISILEPVGSDVDFVLPIDIGINEVPSEDGDDYSSIAKSKAIYYGRKSGLVSIADDSGLEVFALDGYPGIKSARIKSAQSTDKSKYEFLLELMKDIPIGKRGARFVCTACAYLTKVSKTIIATGEWEGEILLSSRGEKGFGYDPVFFIPELGKTAAELSTNEKNMVSHRGKAFRLLWEKLRKEI